MDERREVEAEQGYIDRAYEALEAMREAASRLRDAGFAQGGVGTHQARYERDVFVETALRRLQRLDIGRESLVFGRTDHESGDRFYVGRVAVSGEGREPLVVDWRAPAAEPFYRATGMHPMGLRRRRHFLSEGQKLVALSDEHFGAGAADLGLEAEPGAALTAALERERTGRMRDIVATIQREQDEIIRADLPGILVVQGGPGTGKTAVALHRAAYLLFTHRHRLERDGILVVGPNQLFLRYIEQVLPALGESGVSLTTVEGFVPDVRAKGKEPAEVARLKGDPRMAQVIARAVRDRQRPLRRDVKLEVGGRTVRFSVRASVDVVTSVRRRRGLHNEARAHVERLVLTRLYRSYERSFKAPHTVDRSKEEFAAEVAEDPAFWLALDRMWPRLTSPELVHDLLGARPLIASASERILSGAERALLYRPWSETLAEVAWTPADIPLIDEAASLLGARRPRGEREEMRDYGHIVVDEAQTLTPMQLRMLARRSRGGSMTLAGDIAQTGGDYRPEDWLDVLAHLPARDDVRTSELSVNYRTPEEIMRVAAGVLDAWAPHLKAPRAVRSSGDEPRLLRVNRERLAPLIAAEANRAREEPGGTVAIICPDELADELSAELLEAGAPFAAHRDDLDSPVTLVEASLVKGLEFDSVILVEPSLLLMEPRQGRGALYVALTRATKRLVVVHSEALPPELARGFDQQE